jgi:hypothetical protein
VSRRDPELARVLERATAEVTTSLPDALCRIEIIILERDDVIEWRVAGTAAVGARAAVPCEQAVAEMTLPSARRFPGVWAGQALVV